MPEKQRKTGKDNISNFTSTLNDAEIQSYLNTNQFQGITYISRERLENLLDWIFTISAIEKCREIFIDKEKRRHK